MGDFAKTHADMVAKYRMVAADEYSNAEREKLAKKGAALPDGSYPITDAHSLESAIRLVGKSKNHSESAVRAHIMKRARELGLQHAVPYSWNHDGSVDKPSAMQ